MDEEEKQKEEVKKQKEEDEKDYKRKQKELKNTRKHELKMAKITGKDPNSESDYF